MAAALTRYARAGRSMRASGGWLRSLLGLVLIALLFRSLVVAPFTIPSGSMLPQLWVGDYLLVAKWPYGYSRFSFPFAQPAFAGRLFARLPERGDIILFKHPGDHGEVLVKRVIGLPGDRVGVNGGMLLVNRQRVPRELIAPFALPISANSPCRVASGATPMVTRTQDGSRQCRYPAYRETLPGGRSYVVLDQIDLPAFDDFAEVMVPPGRLFLLGDNRDDSSDSRLPLAAGGIGMLPLDHLIGRALVIYWSTDGSADLARPWTWLPALRGARVGRMVSA